MKPEDLDRMLASDINDGGVPMAVVASAGTVNTGAIDPLNKIADVCARHGVWLHVDGAYGAPAILSSRYRSELDPLVWCDSIAIDPHKWLFVPVEAGLVLVRHAAIMREAFSLVPPYLRTDGNLDGVAGPPWFSEFGFQQTRSFRALKTWMALKQYGSDGYREVVEGNLALAEYLAGRLAAAEIRVFEPQSLSIVCFRCVPAALRDEKERVNAFNERILERVQLGGEAFITGTNIDGIFWMRACIVNYRTTTAHIDALVELIVRLNAEALARGV
jgi:glutamate/tyrosine decarboxylase-like PLP-dependent enzyme